ncbi:MAG: DUF2442 domain-containing protein [Phycisphaerae bacterium]|nr:DUF2442 domain-containing protein [Phycisphaerae bacterium]
MRDVIQVELAGGYGLRLRFDNGEVRLVDIAAITPFDGVFEPLQDPTFFAQVRVEPELGTIVWPNGADFCPDVLYASGRIAQPTEHAA